MPLTTKILLHDPNKIYQAEARYKTLAFLSLFYYRIVYFCNYDSLLLER